jgi:hypothetical protein
VVESIEANDTWMSLAHQIAVEANIEPRKFLEVLNCENDAWNPTRQSELHYKFSDARRGIVYGEQERSYGLAMIHLPDHPEISYEQATDGEWALRWMANEWKEGRASQWSCY